MSIPKPWWQESRYIVGGIVGVLLLGAGVEAALGGEQDGRGPSGDRAMARVMCEDFVKERLVSPTSADFSRPDVRNAGGSDYWVAGSVDADNRMGAAIRIDYECIVRNEGDSWVLVDMEHSER